MRALSGMFQVKTRIFPPPPLSHLLVLFVPPWLGAGDACALKRGEGMADSAPCGLVPEAVVCVRIVILSLIKL